MLKDVSLSAYVPPLKKSLENIIYQVKMLVTRNGIPAPAFFMGKERMNKKPIQLLIYQPI